MKKALIVSLFAGLMLSSCALTTPQSAPRLAKDFAAVGSASGKVCRNLILGVLPLGSYDVEAAVAQTAKENKGDSMVEVKYTHTYTYYWVFGFATECVEYSGTVVKFK